MEPEPEPAANCSNDDTPMPPPAISADSSDAPTEALGTEDKIELQAFLNRKAWIDEKTKAGKAVSVVATAHYVQILEETPPIDIFAGLEDVLSSSEDVKGLPTREQLQTWVKDHDAIEKEAEQFDKGDMIKLKNVAKGYHHMLFPTCAHYYVSSYQREEAFCRGYRPH